MISWALFGFGTLGGAAYGIYLGKEGLKKREIENEQLKRDMHAELERIASTKTDGGLFKKARLKEGRVRQSPASSTGPATSPAPPPMPPPPSSISSSAQ